MQKRFLLIALLIIAAITVGLYLFLQNRDSEKEIHYHAGFIVFKDKQKVDFTDSRYMTVKPCEMAESNRTPEEIQLDKAHLHGGVGDVLHVHTNGAKWKDIFTNLDYKIDYSVVNAYLNSHEIEDLAERAIEPYDSLVVFIGEEDMSLLSQEVKKERIVEVESTSVECGN